MGRTELRGKLKCNHSLCGRTNPPVRNPELGITYGVTQSWDISEPWNAGHHRMGVALGEAAFSGEAVPMGAVSQWQAQHLRREVFPSRTWLWALSQQPPGSFRTAACTHTGLGSGAGDMAFLIHMQASLIVSQ